MTVLDPASLDTELDEELFLSSLFLPLEDLLYADVPDDGPPGSNAFMLELPFADVPVSIPPLYSSSSLLLLELDEPELPGLLLELDDELAGPVYADEEADGA